MFLKLTLILLSYSCYALCECDFYGPNNETCYFLITDGDSWYETLQSCYYRNGSFAAVTDALTNTVITNVMKPYTQYFGYYFIGGIFISDSKWIWINGNNNTQYANWAQGEPQNPTAGYCIGVDGNGKWHTFNCTDGLLAICESKLPISSSCPNSSWIYANIGQEKCYMTPQTPCSTYDSMDWNGCLNNCQQLGGSLVSIHSDVENRIIGGYFDMGGATALWIGLYVEDKNGNFAWSDKTTVDYNNYYFDSSQEYNLSTIYKHGYWWSNNGDEYIYDWQFNYICEYIP